MSGQDGLSCDPTGPGSSEEPTPRHGRKPSARALIGLAVGALAVSGAIVAVLTDREGPATAEDANGSGEAGDGEPEVLTGADGEPMDLDTEWLHTFDEDHEGVVWITVTAPDTEVRSVTVSWGPWERHITHATTDPASYHFSKNLGPTVTTVVRVDPAAHVTFGQGAPPEGAIDVNDGWERIPEADA